MTEPWLILDVSNLSHRNWHALRQQGTRLPIVFGLLRDLYNLAYIHTSTKFLFCFDSDRNVRHGLYPEYKANRKDPRDRQELEIQMQLLREEFLPILGYRNVYRRAGAEADDLMALLLQQLPATDKAVLVSSDQDLWQLLSDRVTIWNPAIKQTITEQTLWERNQIKPSEIVLFKALVGCSSDNVGGVPGIGEMRAAEYIRGILPCDSPYYRTIKLNDSLLERNTKLIQLPCPLLSEMVFKVREDEVDLLTWNDLVSSVGFDALMNKVPGS